MSGAWFDPRELHIKIEQAYAAAAEETKDDTVAIAPSRRGELRKGIQLRILGPMRAVIGVFGGRAARYVRAVERGSRPHVIRPRNARALTLPGAHPVEEVHHPGARAQHFLTRGAARFPAHFRAELRRRLGR